VLPIPDQHRTTEVVLRSIRDDGVDVEGVMIFAHWWYEGEIVSQLLAPFDLTSPLKTSRREFRGHFREPMRHETCPI